MHSPELFHKNIDLWARFCPQGAEAVRNLECRSVDFVNASNGELNLRCEMGNGPYFVHDPAGPGSEALEWCRKLRAGDITVLCVYGIGLGYIYEALKPWLKSNQNHVVIFIEENLEIIHRFLEMDRATEFLSSPQSFLYVTGESTEEWKALVDWMNLFAHHNMEVEVSPAMQRIYPKRSEDFRATISYLKNLNFRRLSEFKEPNTIVLENYFKNVLKLQSAYMSRGLFGEFCNVPAIICGAGPSLDKNIEVLRTLSDRALIFAGGTGINAVNGGGVIPHFCVSIDPNPAQKSRVIMTQNYEVPVFFRNRINSEALDLLQGDRLYIRGLQGHEFDMDFEKALGPKDKSNELEEGLNVLTLSLNIARALGCNPIICVGIDLAYTDGRSYASNILNHPLFPPKKHLRTKLYEDELLLRADVYGKDVNTLWKWVGESLWYQGAAKKNPEALYINSTEGGIGFPGIVHIPLQEVKDSLLSKTYDFGTWILGEVHNAPTGKAVTPELMREVLVDLAKSLRNCSGMYKEIVEELGKSDKIDNEKIRSIEEKIHQEMGYKCLLLDFDKSYKDVLRLDELRLEWFKQDLTLESLAAKKNKLLHFRVAKLKVVADVNAMKVEYVVGLHDEESQLEAQWLHDQGSAVQKGLRAQYPVLHPGERGETYEFKEGMLTMVDKELGLDIRESFSPKENIDVYRQYYESGNIKVEQYHCEGQLHGPTTFYKDDGAVLARGWYYHGLRVGRMWSYYSGGEIHSVQCFVHGMPEGLQQYFYADGLPKSLIPYSKGLLHGAIQLFHPSGHLSRYIEYKNGKRDGVERIWGRGGRMLVEAFFSGDKPVGIATEWYSTGKKSVEITYDGAGVVIAHKSWYPDGTEVTEALPTGEEYFERMGKEIASLTGSLEMAAKGLTGIPKEVLDKLDVKEEMARMNAALGKLKDLGKNVGDILVPEEGVEAIWQNAAFQGSMEKMVLERGVGLSKDLVDVEKHVEELFKKLYEHPPKDIGNDKR